MASSNSMLPPGSVGSIACWPHPFLKSVVYLPAREFQTRVGNETYSVYIPAEQLSPSDVFTGPIPAPYGIFMIIRTMERTQSGKIKIAVLADSAVPNGEGGVNVTLRLPYCHFAIKCEDWAKVNSQQQRIRDGLGGDNTHLNATLLRSLQEWSPEEAKGLFPAIWGTWYNDKHIFCVLEYMDGGSLYDVMKSSPQHYLSEPDAAHYFSQVIRATALMHRFNWCHRDISPCNILVSRAQKRAVLNDFGTAMLMPAAAVEPAGVAPQAPSAEQPHPVAAASSSGARLASLAGSRTGSLASSASASAPPSPPSPVVPGDGAGMRATASVESLISQQQEQQQVQHAFSLRKRQGSGGYSEGSPAGPAPAGGGSGDCDYLDDCVTEDRVFGSVADFCAKGPSALVPSPRPAADGASAASGNGAAGRGTAATGPRSSSASSSAQQQPAEPPLERQQPQKRGRPVPVVRRSGSFLDAVWGNLNRGALLKSRGGPLEGASAAASPVAVVLAADPTSPVPPPSSAAVAAAAGMGHSMDLADFTGCDVSGVRRVPRPRLRSRSRGAHSREGSADSSFTLEQAPSDKEEDLALRVREEVFSVPRSLHGWAPLPAPPHDGVFCKEPFADPMFVCEQPYFGVAFDLFSIGVSLYYAATGRLLYRTPHPADANFNVVWRSECLEVMQQLRLGVFAGAAGGDSPASSGGEGAEFSDLKLRAHLRRSSPGMSEELIDLLVQLLHIRPATRPLSAQSLLQHKFFRSPAATPGPSAVGLPVLAGRSGTASLQHHQQQPPRVELPLLRLSRGVAAAAALAGAGSTSASYSGTAASATSAASFATARSTLGSSSLGAGMQQLHLGTTEGASDTTG